MTAHQGKQDIQKEKLMTFGALSLLMALFVAYVYFLSASVVHVVIRKEVTGEIAQLNSQVGQLEAEYIQRQHAVSDEIAMQKGFVAVRDKIFLDRSNSSVVVSAKGTR